jgi:L-gulonolactone oxidase
LQRAAHHGHRVKVVGGGHSFSEIALSEGGVLVSLDNMKRVLSVRPVAGGGGADVWVQAGIRLHELNDELAGRGLALGNLGATAEQSLGGAISTGTHGTGVDWGSLSTLVTGFRMVTAKGDVVTATRARNREVFAAGRVGLGALGIMTAVRVRCVPAYRLRLTTIQTSAAAVRGEAAALMATHPRVQWYFTPYTDNATILVRDETSDPITPGGCWDRPKNASGRASACVDASYKALVDSRAAYGRRELYTEMEMFVAAADAGPVLDEFRAYMEQPEVRAARDPAVRLFTGVRYVQGDDIWLSPCYGRATAVISFIVFGSRTDGGNQTAMGLYARELERISRDGYGGRPHWGKVAWSGHAHLAAVYPRWADFLRLRAKLDPHGMFVNAYLEDKLGIGTPAEALHVAGTGAGAGAAPSLRGRLKDTLLRMSVGGAAGGPRHH